MNEEGVFKVLRDLGLSKRETDIYLFLARKGPQKAHAVAAYLNIDRAQTYRSLSSLQEKGVVEVSIEAPTRYLAVPIEPLIESFIKTKKNEVAYLEAQKEQVVNYLKSVRIREPELPMAKFQVLTGRTGIYSKILQMMNEAKSEMLGLTTSLGLLQEDTAGIQDTLIELSREKKDVKFRMLANISKENLSVIKDIAKRIPHRNANVEWRHSDLGATLYPRFMVKDENEAILYVTSVDEGSASPQADTGLWITSKVFVSTLRASFAEIWHNAADVNERIKELETGRPTEKTVVIKEPGEAQRRIKEVLDAAKSEVTMISPSTAINKMLDDDPFREHSKKGVKIRIMAPVDLDNLDAAQQLSKMYALKHVSISYLTMMVVDNEHLFMFKAPPVEGEIAKSPFYLRDTFYTDDQEYVERTSEFLNDIWKRGVWISEINSGGSNGTPIAEVKGTSTLLEVADVMLKNNVSSVLVNQDHNIIGIIDQRDILDKVLKKRRDPKQTTANEVMSTPVLVVDSKQPLIEALRIMRRRRIPRVAVMKEGKLVAMLT